MRTLLQIVQAACDEMGIISRPDSVYGNSDPEVRQLLALANLEGRELAAMEGWQGHWPQLIRAHSFTLAENVATYAGPSDLGHYINETIWDTGQDWPIDGPITSKEWALINYGTASIGPRMRFRVKGTGQSGSVGGLIELTPTPASTDAGRTVSILYSSSEWVLNGAGNDTLEEWSSDADTPLLPDECFISGIKWRFKASKGLDYGEEKLSHDRIVARNIARAGMAPTLDMGRTSMTTRLLDEDNIPDTGYGS